MNYSIHGAHLIRLCRKTTSSKRHNLAGTKVAFIFVSPSLSLHSTIQFEARVQPCCNFTQNISSYAKHSRLSRKILSRANKSSQLVTIVFPGIFREVSRFPICYAILRIRGRKGISIKEKSRSTNKSPVLTTTIQQRYHSAGCVGDISTERGSRMLNDSR